MFFPLLILYSHHCTVSSTALILIISPHSADFWVLLSSAVQGLGSWCSPVIPMEFALLQTFGFHSQKTDFVQSLDPWQAGVCTAEWRAIVAG